MATERQARLGIIGAGNAYKDLVRPALKALPGNEIVWVAGLERRSNIQIPDFRENYIHMEAGEIVRLPFSKVDAVLDLTPHQFHANNLRVVFEAGKAAYVEKPFAISNEQINDSRALLVAHPNQLAYFVTYYRDEKGLGLRALTGEITRHSWYAQFLKPMDERLPKVLDSLGDIELVVGTCLEGPGYDIVSREHLCDPKTGGMALDLGDHVFSYLTLLKDRVGPVSIETATAGVSIEAREHYAKMTGNTECSEMYVDIKLRGRTGFPMRFAIGKYTGINEWAFYIQARNGYVYMNLDSGVNTMQIRSPIFNGEVKVEKPAPVKYTIVMSDFLRRLRDPSLNIPYGFDNASETLGLVLKIRDNLNRKPRFEFETGNIPGMEEITKVYRSRNGA